MFSPVLNGHREVNNICNDRFAFSATTPLPSIHKPPLLILICRQKAKAKQSRPSPPRLRTLFLAPQKVPPPSSANVLVLCSSISCTLLTHLAWLQDMHQQNSPRHATKGLFAWPMALTLLFPLEWMKFISCTSSMQYLLGNVNYHYSGTSYSSP